MNRTGRRLVMSGVAAVAGIALAAAPASAHFCYKKNVNDQAAAGMAGSANWVSFADMAAQEVPDMCEAGVALVAAAAGVTPETLINTHGTMAAGTLKKAETGNPAIGHLDFQALEAALPDGYAACG